MTKASTRIATRAHPDDGPLYQWLERELRRRIEARELAPGDALPSEEGMCEAYGVSRITVRRALEGLIEQGLILRRRGVGSFVARRNPGMNPKLTGSLQQFLTLAAALRTDVLAFERVGAPEPVREIFGYQAGAEAYRLIAVGTLDGEGPVSHLTIWFPLEIGELLRPEDLATTAPIVRVVERRCGFKVVRAEQVVEADHAGPDASRHLQVDEVTPILRALRVYYAAEDRPVEIAYARYHPERYRYAIDFRPT